MTQNGVIETATGDLLRAGFCDFESDGSFDAGTETMRTDCPHPAKHRGDPDESQMHRWTGSEWTLVDQPDVVEQPEETLTFTMQNNGAVLNTGVQKAAYFEIVEDYEILGCKVFGGPSGSIVVDLWQDTFANYPPTDADSITASAPPTISDGVKSEDTTLTGWTKLLDAGSGILVNIDSVTNMTWVKVVLIVKKRYS